MDKLIYFHMNQLGDLMFSLPLMRAAKSEWKNRFRSTSYVSRELSPILAASGLADDIIEKPAGCAARISTAAKVKGAGFARAVLFSESPESVLTGFTAGIPFRAGFKTAAFSFLLTHKADRTGVPSLANNRNLARVCGLEVIAEDYEGLVTIPEQDRGRAVLWKGGKSRNTVVVGMGASRRRRDKCWSDENWIAVLEYLNRKNLNPILAGSPSEKDAMFDFAHRLSFSPMIYDGREGILFLGALMRESKYFIGIDSGAMHYAAALNVPVIALFGPTDPSQVGPRPLNKHKVIKRNTMDQITPGDVIAEIEAVI
jgi:ADP-heptose:LPS heptosyltransferase